VVCHPLVVSVTLLQSPENVSPENVSPENVSPEITYFIHAWVTRSYHPPTSWNA
jgi:hypothetical protein